MVKKWFVILFSLSVFIYSCDSDEDSIDSSQSESEEVFEDVMYMNAEINSAMSIGISVFTGSGGRIVENEVFCGTFNFSFEPVIALELDFGEGCTGVDGKNRAGKIKFTTEGEFGKEGFSYTLSYDNFSVDGNQLSGSISSSGYVLNDAGNFEYTITSNDFLLTLAEDESTISYSGTHTYEWLEGFGSEDASSNVFKVTGSSSGKTRKGVEYSSEITSPYTFKAACYSSGVFYPVSGVASITPVDSPAFTVDFGDGSCDKKATIAIGALSYEIDLP